MAKRQTRRSISVTAHALARIRAYADSVDESVSSVTERDLIDPVLDGEVSLVCPGRRQPGSRVSTVKIEAKGEP